jgi:hypothetical protein
VHGNLLVTPGSEAWVAVGQYKGGGAGGSGDAHACDNDYGAQDSYWSAYVDRKYNGVYGCYTTTNTYTVGNIPPVKVVYESNCLGGLPGWQLWEGGDLLACFSQGFTYGVGAQGFFEIAQSDSNHCWNGDVRFIDMMVRSNSGTWSSFGGNNTQTGSTCYATNHYNVDWNTTQRWDSYSGALD